MIFAIQIDSILFTALCSAAIAAGSAISVLFRMTVSLQRSEVECRERYVHLEIRMANEKNQLLQRIACVEAQFTDDWPKWIHDQSRQINNVSPEFVRHFATPIGLKAEDFIGKRFDEIEGVPETLCDELSVLEALAIKDTYACKSGVEWFEGQRVTVLKMVRSTINGPVFISIVCPERS